MINNKGGAVNKKILLFLVPFFLLFAAGVMAQEEPHVTVEVVQDGKTFDISRHVINLKKAPFSIRFIFNRPMAVQVAASVKPNRYIIASHNSPMYAFMPPASGLAEGFYNEDKSVFVADAVGTNYWYYSNDHDHRFDDVKHDKNSIICTRTIENIGLGKDKIPIERAGINKLYFVFVNAVNRDRLSDDYTEYQRIFLIINFIGESAGNEQPVQGQVSQEVEEKPTRADIVELFELTDTYRKGMLFLDQFMRTFKDSFNRKLPDEKKIPEGQWAMFVDELKNGMDKNEYYGIMVPIYEKYFTRKDIRGMISFYKSPVGQKLLKVTPDIMKEGGLAGQEWAKKIMPDIMKKLMRKLKQMGYSKKDVG